MANIQEIIKSTGFIYKLKSILIVDCITQLEGRFGIKSDGTFENISLLPNLEKSVDDLKIREKLEAYFKIQKNTNKKPDEILTALVKEYAFTYLNRFVAIKMMEERKIIKQSFSRGFDSNNFKFYLADNQDVEKVWRKGNIYESYKIFLYWLFKELSNDDEIKVLFDIENVCTLLFPSENTLRKSFDILNNENLNDIWREDEVIGWVYQYFIEDEKAKVFNKIYKEKKKLDLRDIPAATQIFTPKWIVKYLVENTLGRLWLRMHPDTKLIEKMDYYVPNEQDKDILPLKKIKEITLLDPACGTMHFGMYAFDLYYEMYIEEFNNKGFDGWLKEASVKQLEDIPKYIIEHNIFGIDIDLRAIQLSALSLYLKAKSINKNITLKKYNLTYTDIPPFTIDILNKFVKELKVEHVITKKLLEQILPIFNKAYYLGSLLKIEETVESFVEKEKINLKKVYQYNLFGNKENVMQMELGLELEKNIIWEDVKNEIKDALVKFATSNTERSGAYIAGESVKGLSLIDALIRKYDIVVTNPPYSGKRNWPEKIFVEIKAIYENKANDLYTCFLDRCIDLSKNNGFIGMVTIHSFMFTNKHESLRRKIIDETVIETLCHLGTKSEFEVANKTAQGFVMYSLQKKTNDNSLGVYFRLVNQIGEDKHLTFLKELKSLIKENNSLINHYILEQNKLKLIPKWPIIYFISDQLRKLFQNDLLLTQATACQGLATANNKRFLRFWWEVGINNVKNSLIKIDEKKLPNKWNLYMKGGEVKKWYGNLYYVINWDNDGHELKNYICEKYPYLNGKWEWVVKNSEFYFLEGITYSDLTVSEFTGRYMPKGFIFDVQGSAIFLKNNSKLNIYILLGILNSKLSVYLLKLINPTVHTQVGDISRLPLMSNMNNQIFNKIESHVKKCISIQKKFYFSDELSMEFLKLEDYKKDIEIRLLRQKELSIIETELSNMTYNLYLLENEEIEKIESEFGKLPGNMKKVENIDDLSINIIKQLYLKKQIPSESMLELDEDDESDEVENVVKETRKSRFLTFDEICLASGYHPDTVYKCIITYKLERPEERYELAVKWISYTIGILMGRFNHEGISADDDGICVLDNGHRDDLPKNVFKTLELILKEKEALEVVETLNKAKTDEPILVLRKFLNREFFINWHIPMYKKRPVYWLLQSRKKIYGFYIYNLKFTNESLYSLIQKYIIPKLQFENNKLSELLNKRDVLTGQEKRKNDVEINQVEELIDDIELMKKDIQEVIDSGFKPDIDDGVIINMAPIYKIIPSWKEPEKYYKELKEGKYEWSTVSKLLFKKSTNQ